MSAPSAWPSPATAATRPSLWRAGTLDFYLARTVLLTTLATWAVLAGFDLIIAFASEIEDIGKDGYSLGHAVLYLLHTVPRRLYELFPTVALIGSLLGLGGLAGRSELTAMRALGYSRLRIGAGMMLALVVITALMVINAEILAPAAEQRAQTILNEAKSRDLIVARYSGLWAREGRLFLNARTGAQRQDAQGLWTELQGVRLFEFDAEGRLLSLAQARTAEHRHGAWLLHDVVRQRFQKRSVKTERLAEERWDSSMDDQVLAAAVARPRYMSSAELSSNIDYLRRNSLNTGEFENAYWSRLLYPMNVLALCLAALPFAFGSLRSGGLGKRLFIGIVIGIGFLLVQRLCASLADVYRFDVRLAHLLPPVLLLAMSGGLLARRR